MHNKITSFLTGIALAASMLTVFATSASVATVPQGMITFSIVHGSTNYLSLPLTNTESFTSKVTSVTGSTISVSDTPAPFTISLAVSGAPYFVKFLSGNETGRVVLITGNTTSVLTLDTTDHATGSAISLDTGGFDVEPGDAFEIFPGDTLASIFGNATPENPMMLTGGTSALAADTVSLFTAVNAPATVYYFNTNLGYWKQVGASGNADATVLYPYSAFAISRQLTHPDTTLAFTGRVTPVAIPTKLLGQGSVVTSTHYATDVKLSQLQFGPTWKTGTSVLTSDTVSVWNSSENGFDVYYQKPDSTWRRFPDMVTDQSNFAIAAGTVTEIAKQAKVTGSDTFLQTPLPYSLD